MSHKNKTVVQRAAELLKENPKLKYYEAMEMARRENNELEYIRQQGDDVRTDRGAVKSAV